MFCYICQDDYCIDNEGRCTVCGAIINIYNEDYIISRECWERLQTGL